ncbi:cadherin-like beta sandwich domain-containing protein [Candidatus Gottesmanbacteria bacterium]|nr:cadherin-like beta sandwich domain-containing protein [Candidatus Gottesmanbacteria bacterium]
MISSRLRRVEEKTASKRIAIALIGMAALLVFLALFGVKILIGFSLLVDRIRGGNNQPQQQQSIILPPVLDPLPEETKNATLDIRGKGTAKGTVIVYLNDEEYKKVTVADDGTFSLTGIEVEPGRVTISAKITDGKDNVSNLSNVISTVVDRTAPKLTIDKPEDNTTVNDGTHKVTVNGLTEEDMKVTINGRIVVVKSDGSFTYSMPLNDGENKLTIVAKDAAGNETTVERTVTYKP